MLIKSKENKTVSIYTTNNPYGYKYNINHPTINKLYRRYKAWRGLGSNYPLSDQQRFEFENYLTEHLKSKSKNLKSEI